MSRGKRPSPASASITRAQRIECSPRTSGIRAASAEAELTGSREDRLADQSPSRLRSDTMLKRKAPGAGAGDEPGSLGNAECEDQRRHLAGETCRVSVRNQGSRVQWPCPQCAFRNGRHARGGPAACRNGGSLTTNHRILGHPSDPEQSDLSIRNLPARQILGGR